MNEICLTGDAAAIGKLQGELQRPFLEDRAARFERMTYAAQLNESTLRKRAARFAESLSQIAPHWLEETTALARAAGLEAEQLLSWNATQPELEKRSYLPASIENAGECTTFFALGESAANGETVFHKNRESVDEVQTVFIKQSGAAQRFVGSADIGNIGTAHLLNEKGIAGANNTGSLVAPEHVSADGLDDCHLLRYFGETCANLDEIIPCLEDLLARNLVRGASSNTGMILIFADASRGLLIETTAHHFNHAWIKGDAIATRTNHFVFEEMRALSAGEHPGSELRDMRAREMLAQTPKLDIARSVEIACDQQNAPHAICRNPSDAQGTVTVSTSTSIIGDGDCRMTIYNGHPAYAAPVTLSPRNSTCPNKLISGLHNQYYRRLRGWI
jgi:hypothetical protein